MNENTNLQKIRGWLLVYVIWAFWCAAFAITTNSIGVFSFWENNPVMVKYAIGILLLVLLFYGYYIFLLLRLLRKEKGIICQIKLFIILTPIFNAILPAISAFCLKAEDNSLNLGEILIQIYNVVTLGSLFGATVMAIIWYLYFKVSKRVKSIWPEG